MLRLKGLATRKFGARMLSRHAPLTIEPVDKHQGTVIFLHGLGDSGQGWYSGMKLIQVRGPQNIKYILPTAAERPVTINSGMRCPAWYDIRTLSDRAAEDFDGLEESKQEIDRIIDDEIKSGIPSNQIMIGGFSQGGALALHVAYRYPQQLAGALLLSCYLPCQKKFAEKLSPNNLNTPYLMCHGIDDEVVYYDWGQRSSDELKRLGLKGTFASFKDLGHGANEEVLLSSVKFINSVFSGTAKM